MKIDNTFYLISQIKELSTSFIERELKKNNIEGISSSHGSIIFLLKNRDAISMSEIANHIKRDKSTVTTLVGKLEKYGYVSLKKSNEDSRSTLVSLTEKGNKLLSPFEEISNTLFETSKVGLNEKDWEVFRKVLFQLNENLNKK